MKNCVLLIVAFFCITARIVFGDTWAVPGERDYYSENGLYSVHVAPSNPKYQSSKASISVSQIQINKNRRRQWGCSLGYEGSPGRCYITNNGKTVVTIDQINRKKHGGYGDHILAFYNKDSVIKNYNLVEILGLPTEMKSRDLFRKIPATVSSLMWSRESIEFLDIVNDIEYFCMWLPVIEKWLAWKVTTGKPIKVTEEMQSKWVEKARKKVLQYTKDGVNNSVYLGYLRRPEDRKLIEKALDYKGNYSRGGTKSQNNTLLMYSAGSQERHKAEKILETWDKDANIYDTMNIKMQDRFVYSPEEAKNRIEPPYLLGGVEGILNLPELENPKEAVLWIYLISENEFFSNCDKVPFHKIAVGFNDYSLDDMDPDFTKSFPFRFEDVTPGKYKIKVILDRTNPPSKSYDLKCYLEQSGDYINDTEHLIEIKKGAVTKNLSISCKTLVK